MATSTIPHPYNQPRDGSYAIISHYDVSSSPSSYKPASSVWSDGWVYEGKEFYPYVYTSTDIFSYNTTNVNSISDLAVRLNGNTALIRLRVNTKVALADSDVVLGQFNLAKMGISSSYAIYLTGMSDGGNGLVMATFGGDGTLTSIDVITRAASGSIAASSNIEFLFSVPVGPSYLVDDFCGKYFYERSMQ